MKKSNKKFSKPVNLKADFAISAIKKIWKDIEDDNNYSFDNKEMENSFNKLMKILSWEYSKEELNTIFSDDGLQKIRDPLIEKKTKMVCEHEKIWSKQLLNKEDLNMDDLRKLSIWNSYKNLVNNEIDHFYNNDIKEIVFAGSGALPITAIIMQDRLGIKVTCIEMDEDSYNISKELAKRLGKEDNFNFSLSKAENFNYPDNSAIFIASMISNKDEVFDQVNSTSKNSIIALRTVENLYNFVWKKIDENSIKNKGFEMINKTLPSDKYFNTTFFYKKT